MKIEMEMPDLPDGWEEWEYTGEYRQASKGEYVIINDMPIEIKIGKTDCFYPIIRPIRKWRPATIAYIDKGLTARFYIDITDRAGPVFGTLIGWKKSENDGPWLREGDTLGWTCCDVLT